MKQKLLTSTLIAGMLATAPAAFAVGSAGDRELTLQGAGTSSNDFDANIFSLSGSYGWYLNDNGEWGIRQSVGISDAKGRSSDWNGATRLFYDWHFGTGQLRPYLGASLGYIYGESVNETFSAGPEVGLKYYVNDKTFVGLSAEYQFFFEDSNEIDNEFDDGAFYYGLGVGFNF